MENPPTQSYRSPLGRVRGHGAAHEGTHAWFRMKLTALALIPLSIWFVYAVLHLMHQDLPVIQAWLHQPLHAVLMALFLLVSLYHSAAGVQEVVEDYVHHKALKLGLVIANKFSHALLAAFALFALLKLALIG